MPRDRKDRRTWSGVDPSHRDLCRMAAGWLLGQRWCYLAGYELMVPVGMVDAAGVSEPHDPGAAEVEREHRDHWFELRQDRIRAWIEGGRRGDAPTPPKERWGRTLDRARTPRVAVAEVKRARGDLLGDLGEGKMLRYGRYASQCYLVATPDALGCPDPHRRAGRVLGELEDLGLPPRWGVVVAEPDGRGGTKLTSLRNVRPHREATPAEVRLWCYKVGRSLSHRAASEASPVRHELG